MWYWLFKYVLIGPILAALGRPTIEGLENVPARGPMILASNHQAVLDSFYLPLKVKRRITFLAKSEYFTGSGLKGAFQKWFFTAVGQVPIDRTGADAAQDALNAGKRVIESGKLLGIYPEGTRSPDGRLYKGKTGMARLALQTGVQVVPDRIKGVAAHQDHHQDRKADRFLEVRRTRGQQVRRARCHRRGDVRVDAAVRSGICGCVRRFAEEGG